MWPGGDRWPGEWSSTVVDSLNLCGIPGFLLVSIMGRGGDAVLSLSFSCCKWAGSRSCTRFMGLIFAANCAAACIFMWSNQIWRGGMPDSICMAWIGVVVNTGSIILRDLFCILLIFFDLALLAVPPYR